MTKQQLKQRINKRNEKYISIIKEGYVLTDTLITIVENSTADMETVVRYSL